MRDSIERLRGHDWQSAIAALVFVVAWVAVGASGSTLNAKPVAPPQLPAGIQAPPGVVTGILRTSTGRPLEEVRIAVTPVDQSIAFNALERLGLTGLTDSAGRYRLERIPPGRYHILIGVSGQRRFYYPGVADVGQATAIQVTTGTGLEIPDTVVSGGAVTGRVVDLATGMGHRIDNLVLCCDYLKDVRYSQNGLKQGSPFQPAISADGSFVFPFVPPGNYALTTADRSVIPVSWVLAVGTNGTTGLQLDVAQGVEVQGTVLDQTGKPAVSATVQLVPRPANSASNAIGLPAYTGASQFLFENGTPLGPRIFVRRILVPRAYPSVEDIQALILDAGKMQGRSAAPGPDGQFAIKNVYPGAYMLEVTAGGVALPGREIQVGIAGLTNVSFQVPVIQVTGRVITPGGGALPRLKYVRLVRSGSDADIFYGHTDSEGNFSVLLGPGRYRLFTEGLGPAVRSVSYAARDITNAEFTVEGVANPQIVVTLEP